MVRMRVSAGFVQARRTNRAGVSAAAVCWALAIALTGCAAAREADSTFESAQSIPVVTDSPRESFSLRIPDDWNGQVVVLLRGAVAQRSVSETSSSQESVASALLDYRFAVAIPVGGAGGAIAPRARRHIHFMVGFGSPTSVYLVGISRGMYVTLATVGRTGGADDHALVYVPGGFVHVASPALQDSRTIEFALQADEPGAALLSDRLQIDRRDLAHTLEFYFGLLTGVRQQPPTAPTLVGMESVRQTPRGTDPAWRNHRATGGYR